MAIDDLLNEHEQSERVRGWIRSNAIGLIGGVGLGLGAIFGWQWWQGQQTQAQMGVNARYAEVINAYEAGTVPADKGREAIAVIGKGTPTLGTLAALQLAKAQAESGKRDDAIATLRNLRDVDADLRPIVRQRLARLLIDAGKHDEALKLLDAADDASSLEVRGDALLATGKAKEAQEAYTRALTTLDAVSPQRRLVELKLIHAGGTPPKTGGAA